MRAEVAGRHLVAVRLALGVVADRERVDLRADAGVVDNLDVRVVVVI